MAEHSSQQRYKTVPQAPSSKPSVPFLNPTMLNLPPSLPDRTYIPSPSEEHPDHINNNTSHSINMGRSLTNNDHAIPFSMSNGVKLGQSPTILSILTGSDQQTVNTNFSYQRTPSSRTTTAITNQPLQQECFQQSAFNSPRQGYSNHISPTATNTPFSYSDIYIHDNEDEDDLDGLILEDLPFDFTLDE